MAENRVDLRRVFLGLQGQMAARMVTQDCAGARGDEGGGSGGEFY